MARRKRSEEAETDREWLKTLVEDLGEGQGPSDRMYKVMMLRLMARQAEALEDLAASIAEWRESEVDVIFGDEDDLFGDEDGDDDEEGVA